jgi:hypothetical protein
MPTSPESSRPARAEDAYESRAARDSTSSTSPPTTSTARPRRLRTSAPKEEEDGHAALPPRGRSKVCLGRFRCMHRLRAWSTREPDSRVTSRSAFLVAVLRYEGERFGARSGDRFRGFQGCSGLRGDRAASAKTRRIEGKARHQAPSRHPIAGDRSLHGKERVRGSSPREGFASSLLISFFRRLWRRPIRGAASTERPRNGAGGALERPQRSP